MDEHPSPYTYDQAAIALGIQAEAVRARARRNALRRGPKTNDGRPTVLLSPADIATIRASIRTQPAEAGPDAAGRPDERDKTIQALEAQVSTLREQAEKAEVRADQAQANVATERARVAEADREREEARIRAAAAEGEVKGLREALAEARKPFWQRWLGS